MSTRMRMSVDRPEKSIMVGDHRAAEPMFLHRLFEDGISKYADKPALIYQDDDVAKRQTKYHELNQNANQIANVILDTVKTSHPNQDGDWIIAVCMKSSDNLVTILLAIWKAGASYLPLSYNFPQNRIEHILNEAKPVLVIYDNHFRNASYFSAFKSVKYGEIKRESNDRDTENIPDEIMLTKGDASTKAITLYTSGSTGLPKGVRIRHHQLIHRIYWQLYAYPYLDTENYCVTKTELTFIDHVAELWCPLFSGKALIIIPKAVVKDPERFVSILEDYRVERVLGVPTLLRSILLYLNMLESNKTKFMLTNLKMWMSSGETLTMQLANEYFDYFDTGKYMLVNFFGSTEESCDICSYEIRSKEQLESLEKVPIGTVFPNTILYIMGKDMNPVDKGEVGEIYVAGALVSDGYMAGRDADVFMKNPFETEEPYNRMFKTGDFGCIKNGLLYFEGRRDAQIKVRGHRVDVSEVEFNLNELNYVEKSTVLVSNVGQLNQAIIAFILLKKEFCKMTAVEIEKDVKTRLTEYMVPQVLIVEELPYLPSGKVDRQKLLNMYESTAAANNKDVKPENKIDLSLVPKEKRHLAKHIFEIISECLGSELRNKISVKSNFFALGGNSLNSIYTVAQLHENGYFIGITDFLNAEKLGDVLNKVSVKAPKPDDMRVMIKMKMVTEPLNSLEKDVCIQLIAKSFLAKADLDQYLPNLKLEHYVEILNGMYDAALRQGLSFMVKNENGELVGVALNFDAEDHPEVKTNNPLGTIFEFLDSIEKPLLQNKLQANLGEVFQSLMMGTAETLDAKDNIGVIDFMEQEVIKQATAKGFKGVFATNTNPLTQQFGEVVHGYEVLSEIVANQYIDRGGKKPWEMAPDTQKAIIMYKPLERSNEVKPSTSFGNLRKLKKN